MNQKIKTLLLFLLILFSINYSLSALAQEKPVVESALDGPVTIDGYRFINLQEYYRSDYFKAAGKRCGTPSAAVRKQLYPLFIPPEARSAADCTATSTNPTADYDPTVLYEINVVVHIIENTSSSGAISDALVASQIEILNEDFLALTGTLGGNGNDVQIRFKLATQDPTGNPTTGITRSVNDLWFNDEGSYWNTLAWDPSRYVNIYTNSAAGNLGYVPFLPMDGPAGTLADRVVILWSAFGRNAPGGTPFDQGRAVTHEVGHYLGLEHTFTPSGSCPVGAATPPTCYSNGDLICDTNPEEQPAFGCPVGSNSCGGSLDAIDNYMNYSDDTCMEKFTVEQVRRMRCSLESYRPNIFTITNPNDNLILEENFENG